MCFLARQARERLQLAQADARSARRAFAEAGERAAAAEAKADDSAGAALSAISNLSPDGSPAGGQTYYSLQAATEEEWRRHSDALNAKLRQLEVSCAPLSFPTESATY
jgi:hypothetical protein